MITFLYILHEIFIDTNWQSQALANVDATSDNVAAAFAAVYATFIIVWGNICQC